MTLIFPIKGRISQDFGPTPLRVEPTMFGDKDALGWRRCRPTSFVGNDGKFADFHPAVDIVCPVGTPVLAPANGKVVGKVAYRAYSPFANGGRGGYVTGLFVEFRYFRDDKTQRTLRVDHLSKGLPVGTQVAAGKPFAWTGNSGISTGPHAHLEDRHGPADAHWSESNSWFRFNPDRSLR